MPWPRSIRFRYSLRALLVFLTLFALWGGYHTNRGMKERRALEVLRRHDGTSISVDSIRPREGMVAFMADAYKSVVRLVWREPFVTSVSICSLDPSVTQAIQAMPHLEQI